MTLKPLPIKELQERYYHHKPLLQVRHGPAVTDKKRQTATIPYDREVLCCQIQWRVDLCLSRRESILLCCVEGIFGDSKILKTLFSWMCITGR